MILKRPLAVNLISYSVGIIVPGLLSFLFIPFVVNLFGSSSYAEYSLAYNTLNVVSLFCYGWVGQSYIRFCSYYTAAFLKKTLQLLYKSLLVGFLFFFISELLFANLTIAKFLLFAPAFFLSGYYNFFLIMCQAHQKAGRVALSELLRTAINLVVPVLCYLFFKANFTFEILALALMLSYLIPLTIFFKRAKNNNGHNNMLAANISPVEMQKQVLSYGLPVALFLSLSLALSVNDRFIIAKFIGYHGAGNYASIYDIINRVVNTLCAAIMMAFHPHIVFLYNKGDAKAANKNIRRAFFIEAVLFVSGFTFLYFFGIDALNFLFKRDVTRDELDIILFIFAGVFVWQFGVLLHKQFELKKRTQLMAIGVAIALAFNISANVFLLKTYQTLLVPAITTLLASLLYILFITGCLLFKKND